MRTNATDAELRQLVRRLEKTHEGFRTGVWPIADDVEFIAARTTAEYLGLVVEIANRDVRETPEGVEDVIFLEDAYETLSQAVEAYDEKTSRSPCALGCACGSELVNVEREAALKQLGGIPGQARISVDVFTGKRIS